MSKRTMLRRIGERFTDVHGLTWDLAGHDLDVWDGGDEPTYAATLTISWEGFLGEWHVGVTQGRAGYLAGPWRPDTTIETLFAAAVDVARAESDLIR